ncbi:glycosyltransferase family 2 protein [Aerococcaceae bacterium NML210727]|nr:glycosyltransferase family 2 protein [Aerococcaceae bacterium NML210727]MCW6654351.1 glycosyltransferase family 2 protein [Aerococcaceae bacterium NML201296]MCW6664184.1 glycosyltransferase family 2 protein [Aerococcaceae bacterium NML191219]
MIKTNTITLVVPCYNEEETVSLFVEEILRVQTLLPDVFLEVLFVDDGSKDATLREIRRLVQEFPTRISYLSFSRNFGKEAAIIAGLEHAHGEWVALMDADLQDPPAMLVEMLRLIREEGYDVAATRRTTRQGEPAVRSWFASLYYKLNNRISDAKLEEGVRDYRLMTRQVVDAVLSLPEQNRFSKGIFSWVGFDVAYLEYKNVERVAGTTSWSFTNLLAYAVEGFISFSDAPLTVASYIGFLTFVVAFIYGVFIIGRTLLFGTATPGWASLAVLIVGMGGLQLLCLGIVGKYIGKIFIESKKRPHYIVREQQLILPAGEQVRKDD